MKIKILLLLLALSICSAACGSRLPEAARKLAIASLCDFPTNSGENMCRSVKIDEVVEVSSPGDYSLEDAKIWCVELNFVDYTGESGFACLWLFGPDEGGGFQLAKGPLFSEKCTEMN